MDVDLPEVGPWARDKLSRLRNYLAAYTTIMKKQTWAKGYVYVDAFAGAGDAVVRSSKSENLQLGVGSTLWGDNEAGEVLAGSPRVALEIDHPFTHYVFLDRDPKRLSALEDLKSEFKGRRSVLIRKGDSNSYFRDRLIANPKIDWRKWRAVVFLDPFGMQVPWDTIAGLAKTKAIEVFINFPLGMAIQRLLKRSGQFTKKERAKLDSYFGDPGWFDLIYEEHPGLFGTMQTKATDSGERLVKWYRERLKTAFGYVSSPYLITNSRGGHLYYLLFAGPNETGAKIAGDILCGGSRI